MRPKTYVELMAEQTQLELQAERIGYEVNLAIAEMARAIRESGEKSREATEAEAKADALFEQGEQVAERLLKIEALLGDGGGVVAKVAA